MFKLETISLFAAPPPPPRGVPNRNNNNNNKIYKCYICGKDISDRVGVRNNARRVNVRF